MGFATAMWLSCALNVVVSILVRRNTRIGRIECGRSIPMHALFAVLSLGGLSLAVTCGFSEAGAAGAAGNGMAAAGDFMFLLAMMALSAFCLLPFLTFLVGEYFQRGQRFLLSLDQLKVARTYDQAEALERKQDWEGALAAYRKYVASDPEDAEAWRRMAEIHLKLEAVDAAIACLSAVVPKLQELEPKGVVAFRLAEILAERRGDRAGARQVLLTFEKEATGTKLAEYARRRIEGLS
ncbi:MAG: tetratricopeptide repeat protein [Planctomycetes bacterium]|nr:tetratricopeptide repeat protein [Planctomycetota bacterium]